MNYNVTFRRVRATILAVEKQWVYTTCGARASVCVCVFLALGMQQAMRMRHIIICGLFHIISSTAQFSGKKSYRK